MILGMPRIADDFSSCGGAAQIADFIDSRSKKAALRIDAEPEMV